MRSPYIYGVVFVYGLTLFEGVVGVLWVVELVVLVVVSMLIQVIFWWLQSVDRSFGGPVCVLFCADLSRGCCASIVAACLF